VLNVSKFSVLVGSKLGGRKPNPIGHQLLMIKTYRKKITSWETYGRGESSSQLPLKGIC